MPLFYSSPSSPYHLSAAALILDESGKICAHYFKTATDHKNNQTANNLYILMRETVEDGESLEQAIARGAKEELSMTVEIQRYIGSLVSDQPIDMQGNTAQKTTLYFVCKLLTKDNREVHEDDPETFSEIVWLEPHDLIEKMKDQRKRTGRNDIDESEIISRII